MFEFLVGLVVLVCVLAVSWLFSISAKIDEKTQTKYLDSGLERQDLL